jgi:hypothetical protein
MITGIITSEVEQLRASGYSADLIEAEGWFNLIFSNYTLPPGYTKSATQLLIKLPLSYPNGKPDMFWVDEDVLLKNGSVPQSAEVVEQLLNKKWRRFSWHPQNWNPSVDNVTTYLEFINRRLAKAV